MGKKIRVALIQCICPHYRVPVLRKLATSVDLTLFYGRGEKKGSWRNADNIEGFEHKKLFSLFLKLRRGDLTLHLVWFPGLLFHLYKLKPEIIISEGFTNLVNNLFIALYCKLFSVPMIIWDSGRNKDKPMSLLRKALEPLNMFLLKKAKALVVYSSTARDYFLSLGITPEKIFIAQNTIDVEACFKDAERIRNNPAVAEAIREKLNLRDKRVILFVGALEQQKNVEQLIHVFAELQKEIPDIALVIVGDGTEKTKLVNLVQRRGIVDCVFTGKITEGVGPYFMVSDVFVLPGRGGLAINQAMAYGKPVIVREGDGTELDLVNDGINGFIVKEGRSFKEPLAKLLKDKRLTVSMGEASRKTIAKYDLDNMTGKFMEAIQYIINQENHISVDV